MPDTPQGQPEKPEKRPLPKLALLLLFALWFSGWLSCSADIRTPFPDIHAADICSVVPGFGLKWTDIMLAVIAGILTAGWAEQPGNNDALTGRHTKKSPGAHWQLYMLAGFGGFLCMAALASLTFHTLISMGLNLLFTAGH